MFRAQVLTLLSMVIGLQGVAAHADSMKILSSQEQDFQNPDCGVNQTCDLKSFSLITENYWVDLSTEGYPGLNYGTRIYAIQKTDSLAHLYNYGIVQFIRGCEYSSYLQDGKVVQVLNIDRDFYGQKVTFQHPTWVIDGVVTDPLDWNFTEDPNTRFSAYKWSPSGDFRGTDAEYVMQAAPTNPMLFVTDHPGVAFYDTTTGQADNISLQFKTCVYRTNDVPKSVPANDIDFAKAIQCFDWSSSWVYDFTTNAYTQPAEITPICLDPNAPRPSSSPSPSPAAGGR